MTQGTSNLQHFQFLKDLSKDIKGLSITVVFTKFNNALNDLKTKMEETLTEELADLDDVQYEMRVLKELTTGSLSKLKNDIRAIFPSANCFIFDPTADQYHYTENINQIYHES